MTRMAPTLALVLVIALAVLRASQPSMRRPLGIDELITVRYYTWVGTEANGEARPIKRRVDLDRVPRPALRDQLIGLYASLGRWSEPNNHLVNSFLVNLSYPLLRPVELAIRLPALLGGVVFAVGLALLCWRWLGWTWGATFIAPVSFCVPYLVQFTQESRGYSWVLALQVLLLYALLQTAAKPHAVRWGALAAGVAVASCLNVVSLAVDWVLPVYAVLWLFPGLLSPEPTVFRKNLLCQGLAIAGVGLVFVVDRLPYIYSSSQQYGMPWRTTGELQAILQGAFYYLLPDTTWILLAMAGISGLVIITLQARGRALVLLFTASLAMSALHFAVTRKLPYLRGFGYCWPMLLVGAAGLADQLLKWLRAPSTRAALGVGFLAAAGWVIILAARNDSARDPGLEGLYVAASALEVESGHPTYYVLAKDVPTPAELYLPPDWVPAGDMPPTAAGPAQLMVVLRQAGQGRWGLVPEWSAHADALWPCEEWPAAMRLVDEPLYRIVQLPGRFVALDELAPEERPALLFWHTSFESTAVQPGPLYHTLQEMKADYLDVQYRYAVKVQFFSRISLFLIPCLSAQDRHQARNVAQVAQARHGGTFWAFIPDSPR